MQRSTRGRSGRDGNAPVPHMNQAIRTNINHNDSNPNIPTDLPGKNKIIMESADSRLTLEKSLYAELDEVMGDLLQLQGLNSVDKG